MNKIQAIIHNCLCTLFNFLVISVNLSASERPNFLFIWIDDLRAELGCYGADHIISPNIDKLASRGVVFDQAYCQEAICTVSRASLVTGQRPNRNGVQHLRDNFREKNPEATTIMDHLGANGYETIGMGKQLHHESSKEWGKWISCEIDKYHEEESKLAIKKLKQEARSKGLKGMESYSYSLWNSTEMTECDDNQLHDGYMTDVALNELDRMLETKQNFFMSVGYRKPHLPFVAPKKYWDMYDRTSITVAKNHYQPENMPSHARTNWGELKSYRDIPSDATELSAEKMLELTHGYYACISYVDAQIGRLLQGLESKGLSENTVIVLTSDHGYKLGEHKMWCKHTNFDIDLKVPLIVRVPGSSLSGQRSNGIVELIDLFPTFCDYAGISVPKTLDGSSFRGLIEDPESKGKQYAYSQYPSNANGKYAMGYSLSDGKFRYTEWVNDQKKVNSRMLYNLLEDPNENLNIASKEEHFVRMLKYSTAIKKIKSAK